MRISVIIPCYNVAHYVQRAVESALGQTHAGVEVICVNDGSTDDTQAILRSLKKEHGDRLLVIEQPNRGACAARNAGMHQATGTYLQFLDADDVLLPSKLEHQAALAERTGLPGIIIGSSRTVSASGKVVRTVVQDLGPRDTWLDLMRHRLNITSPNLWQRQAVMAVGGWQEGLGSSQEYDLMFRLLKAGERFVFDDAVLTEIHQRPGGSISQTNIDKNWVRFIGLRAEVIEHVRQNGEARDLQPYYQVLFDGIRTLYPFDRGTALRLYRELVPREFRPGISTATGRGYLLLHRLFGFSLANRIRTLL